MKAITETLNIAFRERMTYYNQQDANTFCNINIFNSLHKHLLFAKKLSC